MKDIMVQNVEQILSRGERIELLVDKTDNMASQATAFRRGARTVRRQMWWKNKRILGLGVLVGLVRTPCFSHLSPCLTQAVRSFCLSGDPLGYHGPVLWRCASLWSKLKSTSFSLLPRGPIASSRFSSHFHYSLVPVLRLILYFLFSYSHMLSFHPYLHPVSSVVLSVWRIQAPTFLGKTPP